jgi:hypothetical protein
MTFLSFLIILINSLLTADLSCSQYLSENKNTKAMLFRTILPSFRLMFVLVSISPVVVAQESMQGMKLGIKKPEPNVTTYFAGLKV